MDEEIVFLSPDMFRHEPLMVRLGSSHLGKFRNIDLKSRYIRRSGMILEVPYPLPESHPFVMDDQIELRIFLPFETEPLWLLGTIDRVVSHAIGAENQSFALVSFRFKDLTMKVAQRLEAHDLIVQTAMGRYRAARLPVKIPIEILGVDVLSRLLILDLSMTGMYISGAVKFPKGKQVQAKFRLPYQKESIQVAGRIVWNGQKSLPGQQAVSKGFGFQFEKAVPEARVALATFCSRSTVFPMI
ncbi:MAG: PilZ domain-containing protein [Bdellovibrionales bacterium]|nr:PilZ domain-containing protein [Bdellovibrionales bacterium]